MRKIKPIICFLLIAALGLTLFGCGSESSTEGSSTDTASQDPIKTDVSEYALACYDHGLID